MYVEEPPDNGQLLPWVTPLDVLMGSAHRLRRWAQCCHDEAADLEEKLADVRRQKAEHMQAADAFLIAANQIRALKPTGDGSSS